MYYDDIDADIIQLLQGDIPLQSRPYQNLAGRLGISEEDIVDRVIAMKRRGMIRRLGAVLRHQKAGFVFNAMIAWKVSAGQEDRAGNILAAYPQVTHCYLRHVPEEFGCSLFTMVHVQREEELVPLLTRMAAESGVSEYLVLRSIKEFKKTSMQYPLRSVANMKDGEE